MSDKMKVILDCDTGSDDAVAIMMAILSPKIDLLGVSTVAGNKEIGFTTDNTLRVVDMLRSSTPVYRGCATSMVAKLLPNRHGDYTGMTGVKADKLDEKGEVISYHHDCLPMPAPVSREQPEHGVWWLIDTLMKSEGDITLIPTGPLTNIGMALRLEPRIAEKIRQIIFMGGGFKVFNATAASEFNIWADPEAAQIVLTSGVKTITMVPLDATHQANFTREDEAELRQIGTPLAIAVADLVDERIVAYNAYQPQDLPDSAPIHDALCVAYLLDPEVLTDVRHMRVDVDISGGFADGQTICDTRAYPDRPENCYVALGADRLRFSRMVLDMIRDFR
ncbi:MAG: nucleoside hydrolase [Angelakisella sp.]|jgi:inosine-uridine nucleoside N-ribohydrolase|nr:nucleoside hydrolase [Angelakisella sp.]